MALQVLQGDQFPRLLCIGYQDSQKNTDARTIEGDLEETPPSLANDVPAVDRRLLHRNDWARYAHTEKGITTLEGLMLVVGNEATLSWSFDVLFVARPQWQWCPLLCPRDLPPPRDSLQHYVTSAA